MVVYLLDPGDGFDVVVFNAPAAAENGLVAHRGFGRHLARLYSAEDTLLGTCPKPAPTHGRVTTRWRAFSDGAWFDVSPMRAQAQIPIKVHDVARRMWQRGYVREGSDVG